jgi:hypothetical protein
MTSLSPPNAPAWTAFEAKEFMLEPFQLATCDAELGAQANSNVVTNVRYTDADSSSASNKYGPSLQTSEDELVQILYDFYVASVDTEDLFTGYDQDVVSNVVTVRGSSVNTDSPVNSYWRTKADALVGEYWSTTQYCNAMYDLAQNMKASTDAITGLTTNAKIEQYIVLAEEYIVQDEEFPSKFTNRTTLDSQYNPNGDAHEYMTKCALALSTQGDYSEDGEESLCKDLVELTDATVNQFASDQAYLDYCQACENIDLLNWDLIESDTGLGLGLGHEDTQKCLAYLMLTYSSGLTTIGSTGETCCTSLATDPDNRATLAAEGVNMCKMTDEDCKSKVKRYIEKNASPIGIVVFIEVVFMYVVVYVTQKGIKIYRDDDGDDDDEEDED